MSPAISVQQQVLAAALLAVLAAAAPSPCLAQADGRPRPWSLQAGIGTYQGNADFVFGGGLAPWDDGRTRVELRGLMGISGGSEMSIDPATTGYVSGRSQLFTFLAELNVGWRRGALEPWMGVGLATSSADARLVPDCARSPSFCSGGTPLEQDTSGSFAGGVTVAGGARWLLSDFFALEAELRYLPEGRSRFADVPGPSVRVGGVSVGLSAIWRIGSDSGWTGHWTEPKRRPPPAPAAPVAVERAAPPAPPPAAAPPPPAPSAPPEPPAQIAAPRCPQGRVPAFAVFTERRFRCFPDPVRRGFYCGGEGTGAAEFVARDACERACRGGEDSCAPGSAVGAACRRCVEGCAAERRVPCAEASGGAPDGLGCRIAAGRYGLAEDTVVPAQCPAPAPAE